MARPPPKPTRQQRAALDALAGKPDAGLALTTQETISALRAGCKCVTPFRGFVQCIAATLIERMSRNLKPSEATPVTVASASIKVNVDTGGGCSVCGCGPCVNVCGTYWLCGPCVLERLPPQPSTCNHRWLFVSQIYGGRLETCELCARERKVRD